MRAVQSRACIMRQCRALPVLLLLFMVGFLLGACGAPTPTVAPSSLAIASRSVDSGLPPSAAVSLDGSPPAADAAAPAVVIPLPAAPSPLSPLVEPGTDLAVDEFF